MIQYRWYVGCTQQDGERVTEPMRQAVIDYLMGLFKGVTMYPSAGVWLDDDSELHREQTIVFEVVTTEVPNSPRKVAELLARMANQKAVLYTVVSLIHSGYAHAEPS